MSTEYLAKFIFLHLKLLKKAQPYTFIKIPTIRHGTFASEKQNGFLPMFSAMTGDLKDMLCLRSKVNDRVKGLEAGLELEMPGSNGTKRYSDY